MQCNIRVTGAGICLLTVLVGTPALAQTTRADWILRGERARTIDSIFAGFTEAVRPDRGPVDESWNRAIQFLTGEYFNQAQAARDAADNERADRLESLGLAWMRWGVRLAPSFTADTSATSDFLPQVATAWRTARAEVGTDPAGDSLVNTTWIWRAGPFDAWGELAIGSFDFPRVLRINISGQSEFVSGEHRSLPAGTYQIEAYVESDTVRVFRDILPGITTLLDFEPFARRLLARAEDPGKDMRPEATPVESPELKDTGSARGFPVFAIASAVGAVGVAVVFLTGRSDNNPQPTTTTGGIILNLPIP